MPNQEGERKMRNVNLEGCSQILKEIGKTENVLSVDNVCKIAGFSPIYKFLHGNKTTKFYKEGQNSSETMNRTRMS